METKGRKTRNEVLSIDVPDPVAQEFNAILEEHPFSRSRLGLLALEIALPELRRRYPIQTPQPPKA